MKTQTVCAKITDQPVLKMPKIVRSDMIGFLKRPVSCKPTVSMSFLARPHIWFHILPVRRDNKNIMPLQKKRMPELVNESFVGRRKAALLFDDAVLLATNHKNSDETVPVIHSL